jgi:alpha-beta hydrolase superfamily lysophospholipase
MNAHTKIDYAVLDRPEVLQFLFHPRPEPSPSPFQTTDAAGSIPVARDILIPVEEDVAIGARFHMAESSGANLLFFHGNGEIVADYDELGPIYNQMGVNFLAVDYRGYGRSTGRPTVTAMIIHAEFDHIIPFSDGKALYDACQSPDKAFLKIPAANHNDIFMRGLQEYLAAIENLVERVKAKIK